MQLHTNFRWMKAMLALLMVPVVTSALGFNFDQPIVSPTLASSYSDFPTFLNEIATADFDNDGNLDAICSTYTPYAALFYGRGDGTFDAPVMVDAFNGVDPRFFGASFGIFAADIDKDGDVDSVISVEDRFNGPYRQVTLLRNNGSGRLNQFTPSAIVNFSQRPNGVEIVDFDVDGREDIVIGWYGGSGLVSGWFGTSDVNVFTGRQIVLQGQIPNAAFSASINHLTFRSRRSEGMILADPLHLDGDNVPDLIVPDQTLYGGQSYVHVFQGLGGGSVAERRVLEVSGTLEYVRTADLDGDNDTDFMISTHSGVYWVRNDGNYNFTTGLIADLPLGRKSYMTLPFDFDSSGTVDLAVMTIEGYLYLYEGNSSFAYGLPTEIALPQNGAGRIWRGDFNNDGLEDIVCSASPTSIAVLLNRDQSDVTPPVTKRYVGAAVADLLLTLTATDDLSGVALTEYRTKVNGLLGNPTVYTAPIPIPGSVDTYIEYRSLDNAGNWESWKVLDLRFGDKMRLHFQNGSNNKYMVYNNVREITEGTPLVQTGRDISAFSSNVGTPWYFGGRLRLGVNNNENNAGPDTISNGQELTIALGTDPLVVGRAWNACRIVLDGTQGSTATMQVTYCLQGQVVSSEIVTVPLRSVGFFAGCDRFDSISFKVTSGSCGIKGLTGAIPGEPSPTAAVFYFAPE